MVDSPDMMDMYSSTAKLYNNLDCILFNGFTGYFLLDSVRNQFSSARGTG